MGYGGAYGNEPGLINAHLIDQGVPADHLDRAMPQQIAAAKAECHEAYLACMLLRGADSIRYGALKTKLANDMTKGQDHYPKTVVEATRLLNDYRVNPRVQCVRDDPREGVAFVQDRGNKREGGTGWNKGSGGSGRDAKSPNCWHCNQPGHHMNRCPELAVEGIDNLNIDQLDSGHGFFSTAEVTDKDVDLQECQDGSKEYAFAQREEKGPGIRGILHRDHLYINTCASYASTPYRSLLGNVHRPSRGLVGYSNCSSMTMTEMGQLGKIQGM